MTSTQRTRLRQIMLTAWDFHRAEPGRAFADCLRAAWAWTKRMAKAAAQLMRRARRGRINFSPSLIRSPIQNATRAQRYGGWLDHKAAYLTSRIGC
ncbi:MAG: hypothetical protein JO303_16030 [Caulobacteraceae bacterium]|nr:hypothetical protein [Caulobacteraceae bacterium]